MYDTKKLYYEDVYKKEFTAKVLECRESKKGYEIILNQTAFYPEGGGQPSDTGILGGINVKEVHEKDGELVHYTDGPLEVGMDVIGKINWGRRFDLMQQHSGEHIVSGLVHEAFGYDNVGFHMGSDVITIDFSGMLDEEQMLRSNMNEYKEIAKAVSRVEVYKDAFAISIFNGDGIDTPTVGGAKTANDLLDISGIKASFVITPYEDKIYVSARSIDEVNVQLVMEKLGGGGHISIAGAQFTDCTIDQAINKIKLTLDNMIKDGEI